MKQVYVQNFADADDVIREYAAPADALKDATVYLAWYDYGSYDGTSLVIFEKDGVLYEVNGSHCSCYGLEDQWEPQKTSWEALGMRNLGNYTDGEAEANALLQELVKQRPTQKPFTLKTNDRS